MGGFVMPFLSEKPTLTDLQFYVQELEKERGFSAQGPLEKCLLLGQEVGELFKAVRKKQGMGIDQNSEVGEIAGELADLVIYLCSIANRFDIHLESAFREKKKKNSLRKWS
jgi:NTP pyrophosphatase (non-canonical NTP hydrolase)